MAAYLAGAVPLVGKSCPTHLLFEQRTHCHAFRLYGILSPTKCKLRRLAVSAITLSYTLMSLWVPALLFDQNKGYGVRRSL